MFLLFITGIVVIGLVTIYLKSKKNKVEVDTSKVENENRFKGTPDLSRPIQHSASDISDGKQLHIHQATNAALLSEEPSHHMPEKRIQNQASKLRKRGDHRGAYKASRFLPPIEKGYQIFLQNMGVAGLGFRREAAIAFIDDLNQFVRLEREPENSKDENAIKVIGVGKYGEYFIGYLPKDASMQIVQTNSFEHVYARLVRAYRGTDDYLEIQLQIVGLKTKKQEFDAFAKKLPANESQKEYMSYWGISFNESLTKGDADLIISEHSERVNSDESAWNEYKLFLQLVDELDDADQQESYGMRSVPRKTLVNAITKLKAELGSYKEIVDDPELIAESILSEHPEFAAG